MNYLKHYCNLIRKAEKRTPPEGYIEKHHTFPKSIFGKNNRIVILTLREHYIAHCLLVKAFVKRYGISNTNTKKMINALWYMSNKSKYSNSHIYESLRKKVVKLYTGENNPAKKPEIRQKISQANLGRVHTEETRKNMSKSRKGRKFSPRSEETKEKIRRGNIGKIILQETKDKLSKSNKGKKLTQEHKNKISQSNKGRTFTQETRYKIGKAHRGRVHTEEARKNMSEAHKGEKHHKSKWWKITFVDGKEITTWGIISWSKENGYIYSCVYRVYTGKYKKHKNIVKVEVIS